MNIMAVGGGPFEETRPLDEALVEMTGKPRPRALFIPTASLDDPEYTEIFADVYSALGCLVDVLRLHSAEDPAKIADADLIYVGGGNTKMMLGVWRERGVIALLEAHRDAGKPVGGISAGAICWFRVGNSDWPQYEGIPGVNTDRLDGLGWVDLAACPHTRGEPFRLGEFRAMMQREGGVGIGLDNGCGIQIRGSDYRILSGGPNSVAHRIEWVDGKLTESMLAAHQDYRPLSSLMRGA